VRVVVNTNQPNVGALQILYVSSGSNDFCGFRTVTCSFFELQNAAGALHTEIMEKRAVICGLKRKFEEWHMKLNYLSKGVRSQEVVQLSVGEFCNGGLNTNGSTEAAPVNALLRAAMHDRAISKQLYESCQIEHTGFGDNRVLHFKKESNLLRLEDGFWEKVANLQERAEQLRWQSSDAADSYSADHAPTAMAELPPAAPAPRTLSQAVTDFRGRYSTLEKKHILLDMMLQLQLQHADDCQDEPAQRTAAPVAPGVPVAPDPAVLPEAPVAPGVPVVPDPPVLPEAPVVRDAPVVPAAPALPAAPVVPVVPVASPNPPASFATHDNVHYVKVPGKRRNTVPTLANMRKRRMTDVLLEIMRICCGREPEMIREGVKLLVQLLYEVNAEACVAGAVAGGAAVVNPLTPEKTLALQVFAGLDLQKRLLVGTALRIEFGMSIFASDAQCRSLVAIPPAEAASAVNVLYRVWEDVAYEEVDIWAAVVQQVICWQRNHPTELVGRPLAEHDRAVGACVQGDLGGKEMKIVALLQLHEGSGLGEIVRLGMIEERDDYDCIKNTLAPSLQAGLLHLRITQFVEARWINADGVRQVDTIAIDDEVLYAANAEEFAELCLITFEDDPAARIEGEPVCSLSTADGRHWEFARRDFPTDFEEIEWARVPFSITSGGDIKHLMTLQGRGNYSSCRCSSCTAVHSEWQQAPFKGAAITNEWLREQGFAPLIDALRPEDEMLPVVHIKLGLANRIVSFVFDYLYDSLEKQEPAAAALYEEWRQSVAHHVAMEAAAGAAVHGSKEATRKVAQAAKKAASNAKKAYHEVFKARKDRTLQKAVERLLDEKYSIRMHQNTAFALEGGQVTRLLQYSDAIVEDIRTVLHAPELRRPVIVNVDVDLEIDTTMDVAQRLLGLLDFACATIASTANQTAEQIHNFECVVAYLGDVWRHEAGLGVTTKMHMLESHAADLLRRLGSTGKCAAVPTVSVDLWLILGMIDTPGIYSEEAMEREHAVHNARVREFSHERSWRPQKAGIRERMRAQSLPVIQNEVHRLQTQKRRNFSETTVARKRQREEAARNKTVDQRTRYLYLAFDWIEASEAQGEPAEE
jgi:hypothetical protein